MLLQTPAILVTVALVIAAVSAMRGIQRGRSAVSVCIGAVNTIHPQLQISATTHLSTACFMQLRICRSNLKGHHPAIHWLIASALVTFQSSTGEWYDGAVIFQINYLKNAPVACRFASACHWRAWSRWGVGPIQH